MPAEWEHHEATWLSWPKDPMTFPPDILEDVENTYVKMIEALCEGEYVNLLVDDEDSKKHVLGKINPSNKNLNILKLKSADVWMRDYGPIFVKKENSIAAIKWIFNAWGNKYDELKLDNQTGLEIATSNSKQVFEPGIVLEGGSIDVNGEGSCLTTTQCLLNKNRNPNLSKDQISKYLEDYLGITNLIWLRSGIEGDDTDGHVDDIARFVSKDTVVCMVEVDKASQNYVALQENYEILKKSKDEMGIRLNVIPITMPKKVLSNDGELPASYANFYIGNACVLVPIFGGERDDLALSKLGGCFPRRKIVGINCEDLVYGFGGIHCVTQQQPGL